MCFRSWQANPPRDYNSPVLAVFPAILASFPGTHPKRAGNLGVFIPLKIPRACLAASHPTQTAGFLCSPGTVRALALPHTQHPGSPSAPEPGPQKMLSSLLSALSPMVSSPYIRSSVSDSVFSTNKPEVQEEELDSSLTQGRDQPPGEQRAEGAIASWGSRLSAPPS